MKSPNPVRYLNKYLLFLLSILCLFNIHFMPHNAYAEKVFYSIHLGSFDEIEKAKEMVEELKGLGHEAFYRSETREGKGESFNVYIEKFDTRSEAEKEANVLKELDLIKEYTIEELKDTDKTASSSSDKKQVQRGYSFQISSLKEKANAESTVEKLKASGYDAFIKQVTLKGKGVWYRVFIQGFKSKGDAYKAARKIRESGLLSGHASKKPVERPETPHPAPKSDKKAFFLHVSSCRERSSAEQEAKALEESGYKAFFVEEGAQGDKWFRVYIGEFDSEKAARKEGSKLKKKGLISYFKPIEIDRLKMEK